MSESMPSPTRPSFRLQGLRPRATLAAIVLVALMAIPYAALASPVGSTTSATLAVSHSTLPATPAGVLPVADLGRLYTLEPGSGALTGISHIAAELASHPAPAAAPRPAGLGGNTYVNGPCSATSTIANVNGTNSTLLVGLSSLALLFDPSSGGAYCSTESISNSIYGHGFLSLERSSDGGKTWATSLIPANSTWGGTGASALTAPGFYYPYTGLGAPFASPSISSADDGTTLVATQFMGFCLAYGNCTSASWNATDGIAVARSTNGGATWLNTAIVGTIGQFQTWVDPSSTCQSAGLKPGYEPTDIPMSPSVAINPTTDVAVATWANYSLIWDVGGTACVTFYQSTVQESTSINGGVTWSAPKNVTGNYSFNPRVAIGPGPTYPITILSQNWANETQDSTTKAFGANWQTVTSTNNGTSWALPVQDGPNGAMNLLGAADAAPNSFFVGDTPFNYQQGTTAGYTIDATGTSAHSGTQYLVWADNNTPGSSNQGAPSVDFQSRAPGSGWSGTQVLAAGTSGIAYFEPAVSVDPSGAVWVSFYGMNRVTGTFATYAVHSDNGGSTWSEVSEISSAASTLPTGLYSIGQYTGNVGTTAGDFAVWMDCTSSSCAGSANTSAIIAQVEPVNVTAVNATINLTVARTTPTTFPLPASVSWALGSSVSLNSPSSVPHNQTYVASFSSYSGVFNGTSAVSTFTYTGGAALSVNYMFQKAAFIAGTFNPNSSQARLTIDGASVPLTADALNAADLQYNYSVAAGRTYLLNASAGAYYTNVFEHPVGVSAGGTTVYNVILAKTPGWIAGHVTPVNATVTLNGTPISVDLTTGTYNVTEPWGFYYLTATGFGLTNITNRNVTVNPGATTQEPISLEGGWIRGTLAGTYPGVTVRIDGVVVSDITGAVFNNSYLGGTHEIVATAPGYNTSYINVSVKPGNVYFVGISLTNMGTVVGQVTPLSAAPVAHLIVNDVAKGLGGAFSINTATGDFSVSVKGGYNYTVNVTATGYSSYQTQVYVAPGGTTSPISAMLKQNAIVQQNCSNNASLCPPKPGPSNSNSNTLLLVGGIVVVVVVVAAVAAVVLMRRRGGGGGSSPPDGSQDAGAGAPAPGAAWSEGGPGSSDVYGGSPPAPPPSS